MSLADELQKLQQLRDAGTLTAEEFELAKDRLLQAPPPAAPAPQVVVPNISLLKEVDPAVTRVADKAVNFQGVTGVIFMVIALVVAMFILFVGCSMVGGMNDGPLGSSGICDHPSVTCQ
ncbi:SHOCT domain-containing protein [Catellatospora sichuanensis]|uniref:SHOCT domain-containing protein n=1 Tax=Catellatospora sichuanensis TaxID=1969805 RepID=UPI001181EDFF|nr:SHOCT domain-containing protein [Catellatospora sichuanensis]